MDFIFRALFILFQIWAPATHAENFCADIFASSTRELRAEEPGAPARLIAKGENDQYVMADFLERGILHVATSAVMSSQRTNLPIFQSPMISPQLQKSHSTQMIDRNGTVDSRDVLVSVEQEDLGIEIFDRARVAVAKIRPLHVREAWKSLEIETDAKQIYGLGEYPRGVRTDEPWSGSIARTDGEHGNIMSPFFGGVQTYTQFPVAYGVREDGSAFAIFVDTPYKIEWDFTDPSKWKVSTWGDELRYFVFTGKNLKEVHSKYMSIVGKSPLPPRAILGNGISKFGYRNWDDVDHDIQEMKNAGLPVGMVSLDLYWFGGDFIHDPYGRQFTKMGSLTPDQQNFPDFAGKVATLKKQGTEVMLISESYVNMNLPEADKLVEWGCIVKDENGQPIVFENKWWGTGYMIDWTHPASREWIKLKYLPLAKDGIRNFWFDLGEPEAGLYAPNGRYFGVEPRRTNHVDVHNIYNLMWIKRFHEVMDKEMPNDRFYIMNRSGTSGMNRFGAGKWGGDAGVSIHQDPQNSSLHVGDVPELIAHLQNRIKNMPLVGVDYYTSDIGGFHRWALGGNKEHRDLAYTLWYANSALLDIPFRPHLWVKDGEDHYLPTNTGHAPSNYANTLRRVELEPYYYQAAQRATRTGEPIVAPLFYYDSQDPNVREMGHEAYIGDNLLMGIVGNIFENQRDMYLPRGGWYDFETNQFYKVERGRWVRNISIKRDGLLTLPLFARAGAIIPMRDSHSLRLRVYAGDEPTEMTMTEDDGISRDYEKGHTISTTVRQKKTVEGYEVLVSKQNDPRAQLIEMVIPSGEVERVLLNGHEIQFERVQKHFSVRSSSSQQNIYSFIVRP